MVVEPDSTQAFVMLAMAVALYFTPTIIAASRTHPNRVSIMLLNFFLGWTVLGWIASLIWSVSSGGKPISVNIEQTSAAPSKPVEPYQELEKLAALKERGHITDEEFDIEKRKILKR
ncbi:superinfection immunity protein [Pseudomonas fulva]|uniref:superinfection immunity protein n=1 Tax=Pseudomonas fulva TaxID=47880 RepID=UPI003F916E59